MHSAPIQHDLVLIGGGHAHIEVLRRYAMRPQPGVRLTVISREIETPYSGMLPGYVAGHYSADEIHVDLGPLARAAGARAYHDEVVALDLERSLIHCRQRPPVDFDVLSIDTGSTPSLRAPGAAEYAVPVKPISTFTARWAALRARAATATGDLRIGVVGGGAGGVELLLAVRHRLFAERSAHSVARGTLHFCLVTASDDILPTHNRRVRSLYRQALAKAGVEIVLGGRVVAVDARGVTCADGRVLTLDEVLWVTEAAAPDWPRAAGLATDRDGFIRVDSCLRSISHPQVFAAGDIAAVDAHPRAKSGVFAVRQGPPLTANLRRALDGKPLRPFTPQRRFLALISTGDRHAIASRGAFAVSGDWVWRWKDAIDRRFMRRYQEMTAAMPMPATAQEPTAATTADLLMRCGGCGGKIGADILRAALAGLPRVSNPQVLVGLDEPDDAAVVRVPAGQLAVQTVDAFRSFIDDPWLLGRVAAAHCLGDIYAMGANPHTALAMITLPLAAPDKMRSDLQQIMAGALAVFERSGTTLVGGHTAEGAEMMVGFAVNGLVAEEAILRKRGAQVGDALILTRALGSGVLLAAHMRGQAKSRWLEPALEAMATDQGPAARCLIAHGARAMSDITGFGLAGHLLEMFDGTTLTAEVALARLPVLDGAAALAARGFQSSLFPENVRIANRISADPTAALHANWPLCFDPQTAGGLLAAIPSAAADACLKALHANGFATAAIIGNCRPVADDGHHLRLVR